MIYLYAFLAITGVYFVGIGILIFLFSSKTPYKFVKVLLVSLIFAFISLVTAPLGLIGSLIGIIIYFMVMKSVFGFDFITSILFGLGLRFLGLYILVGML